MQKFEYKPEKENNWLGYLKQFNWLANLWLKTITFIAIMVFMARIFSKENQWLIVVVSFLVCFWCLSTLLLQVWETKNAKI